MKSNRIKILVAALVLTLLVAVGVSQTVKRAHMHGDMLSDRAIGFLTDYLDLTEAQQTQVKDIAAKEKPTLDSLHQQMKQGRDALRQLETSGVFDEAKVRAAASQQSQTMTDLIVEKARIHSQLFQILTPEQKTKMTKLMDKHGRGMRHGQPQQQQQDQTPNQ